MKATGKTYSHSASFERMRDILDGSDVNYEEVDSLPDREDLTFRNGYYANCSAVFIDIRKSSSLPDKYKRPRLAKLYRAFISEMVAVMNGDDNCHEINIVGDGVWGVYNTPLKSNIDETFSTAAKLNSAVKMLNYQLRKHGYDEISVGIGISYGRALVIKAGHSGSAINDIVYMGDVVNAAAKLASKGSQSYGDHPVMVSEVFYGNLKEENSKLLSYNYNRGAWHGNVVNIAMNDWYEANCK